MNVHKNARLTPCGRERIVRQVESGRRWDPSAGRSGTSRARGCEARRKGFSYVKITPTSLRRLAPAYRLPQEIDVCALEPLVRGLGL